MKMEDYIITPDRSDLDADCIFVAIRDGMPGTRQLLAEDYAEIGDKLGLWYQKVMERLKGIDYKSGKGLHVYQGLGCLIIERDGLKPKRLLWSKVAADIAKMIKRGRWIGNMEKKTEITAADGLKKKRSRKAWNI